MSVDVALVLTVAAALGALGVAREVILAMIARRERREQQGLRLPTGNTAPAGTPRPDPERDLVIREYRSLLRRIIP